METGAPVLRLQQRVAALESQLAETIRQHTGEASDFHNQLARLQSLLERSEAERQQLEYSLALANQSSRQSEDAAEEKEREFRSIQDSLQSRVSKLTQQCQEWRSTLATVQQARAQERTELQQLIQSKEEQLSRFQSQCKDLECAKGQLESDLTQEQSTIAELRAQVQHLEAELGEQSEALLGRGQELEAASQRERKLQRELQSAQQKARALAESLEAEKGAHLDSKFSADIAQRQLREMEGKLESEKATHRDVSAALEASRRRSSNLQSCLEEENRKHQVLQEQFRSKELGLQSLEQQLKEKQAVVSSLSSQLQLHRTNSDSLKEELTRAQAQQAQLEEEYNGCLKEVGDLIKQFQTAGSSSPSVASTVGRMTSVGCMTSAPHPSHLVETVRQALAGSQAELESTRSQLTAARQSVECLSEECSTYRQVVASRTSAITEAEQRIGENSREISHLTAELGRSQAQLTTLQREGEGLKAQVASLRKEGEVLEAQVARLGKEGEGLKAQVARLGKEGEGLKAQVASLRKEGEGLQQRVEEERGKTNEAKKKVSQLQSVVDSQHSELQSSEAVHKEAISKLSHTLKIQEDKLSHRSTELKNHFEALLAEAEERTEKCRQCADEALLNAEQLSSSNRQLESRLNQLQAIHQVYKNDRACLLACVSLLSGSLFPALRRVQQLVMEKTFLVKQVCSYRKLEAQVSEIVASITADIGPVENGELNGRGNPQLPHSGSKCHPLLRFRKVAIAVVAAKRLLKLQEESQLVFSVMGVGDTLPRVPVCMGRRSSKRKGRVSWVVQPPPKISGEDLARWLRSEKVLLEVRDSLSELQATLDTCTSHTHRSSKADTLPKARPELENAALKPTKDSFTLLLQKIHPHFQPPSSLLAAGSLWQRLLQGLASILRVKMAPHSGYTTCTELGEALHTQLTSLVGRLHDGELERHSLHTRLSQSRAECQQLSEEHQQAMGLAEQLQNELKGMVPWERFEGVCQELQQALHREREAQAALQQALHREREAQAALEQQTSTSHQLQARLNVSTQNAQNKDSALSEAVKELSETRLAVQQWEQQARQAGRRLQQAEEEGQRRGQQLGDTQAALQQAISEKEVIQEVIQHAEMAFRQSKQWLREAQSSSRPTDTAQRILKAAEEFGSQMPNFGPELDNCQLMLKSFVDAHQCALSCLSTLHDQVASCEGHIATLKGELSAACRRQIAEVAASITPTVQNKTKSRTPGNDFFPLRECRNTDGSFEQEETPTALEELSLVPRRTRDETSSPTDDPLLIASQGAKLGAELAKTLNL